MSEKITKVFNVTARAVIAVFFTFLVGVLTMAALTGTTGLEIISEGCGVDTVVQRIRDKLSYARAVSMNPGKLEEYVSAFAKECLKLHGTSCNNGRFADVKDHFSSVIESSRDFSAEEKKKLQARLKAMPDADTCLHGDMHIGNMIMAGGENYWIDLADFRRGHPYFDLGMLHFVCIDNDSDELARRLFHLSHAQMLEVWKVFVSEYFGSEKNPGEIERETAPYSSLYMIHFANRESMLPHWRRSIENNLLK